VAHIVRRDDAIVGLGLDSSERGYPPGPFAPLFERARAHGLKAVAHAGEEGPADYVKSALEALKVERVDHGIRALEDPQLTQRLAATRVPLTVCPLSNVALRVVDDLTRHPLGRLLEANVVAMVNSDDPAYFGGYLTDNLLQVSAALGFGTTQVQTLLRNAIDASFASPARKAAIQNELAAVTG